MKQTALFLLLISASFISLQGFADQAMKQATPNKHQLLKDCERKHQMQDVNLSKSELARLCKDELKAGKQTGATATPPADVQKPPQD